MSNLWRESMCLLHYAAVAALPALWWGNSCCKPDSIPTKYLSPPHNLWYISIGNMFIVVIDTQFLFFLILIIDSNQAKANYQNTSVQTTGVMEFLAARQLANNLLGQWYRWHNENSTTKTGVWTRLLWQWTWNLLQWLLSPQSRRCKRLVSVCIKQSHKLKIESNYV